jgi:hypothetical protein
MGTPRNTIRLAAAAAVFAALTTLAIAGCGSTTASPSAPSGVPSPTTQGAAPQAGAQYPSVVGEWGGGVSIDLVYHDPDAPSSSHCTAEATVRSQTAGSFSGSVDFNGSSINTDKMCPDGFAFTAEMSPDGTITRLATTAMMNSEECRALSQANFNGGNASASGFTVVLTDGALCRWPAFDAANPPARSTGRTFNVVIDRWHGAVQQ